MASRFQETVDHSQAHAVRRRHAGVDSFYIRFVKGSKRGEQPNSQLLGMALPAVGQHKGGPGELILLPVIAQDAGPGIFRNTGF